MSFIEGILYGLISGISEFLPISAQAHQAIAMQLFGLEQREPIRDLLVHIALLVSLLTTCRTMFSRLHREQKLASSSRRSRVYDRKGLYDLRLVKTAVLPMVVGLLFYISTSRIEQNLVQVCLFLILNGILIFIPEFMRQGNKEARSMTGFDGVLIGLSGALSAIPGFSRVGLSVSAAVARGADKQHAYNWALMLSVPALILYICFDILSIFTLELGVVTFATVLGYILSAISSFVGAYLAIILVRSVFMRTGFSGCAYYSWGAALFSFVLYLIA